MPPAVPLFETGADLSAIALIGQTVNPATGALIADATTYNIMAVIDEVDPSTEPDFEDIRPVWSLQKNDVLIGTGSAMRITTLKRSVAGAVLTKIVNSFAYVRIMHTIGTESQDGYFRVGRWEGPHRGHGAQHVTLDCRPCDPNQPQVVYSTSVVAPAA